MKKLLALAGLVVVFILGPSVLQAAITIYNGSLIVPATGSVKLSQIAVNSTLCTNGSNVIAACTSPFYLYDFMSGTLAALPAAWIPVPYNDTALTAVGMQIVCQTGGSGTGTSSIKWQYMVSSDPYVGSPTITDLPGATLSWTTTGGTAVTTFTPVNLTALSVTYVRAAVLTLTSVPPANCTFVLHMTHKT